MNNWCRLLTPTVVAIGLLAGLMTGPNAQAAAEPAGYPVPPPGSYDLPPLAEAADGEVLDTAGRSRRLHTFLSDGRVVLMSFIYSSCSDANGCPLANAVMQQVQQRVARHPKLAGRLRLLSLSFDPDHDTPQRLALYAKSFRRDGDWQFLTTRSARQLQPILDAYGQSVVREVDAAGNPVGSYSHILRVFLIDPQQRIRNIYSTDFLNPDLLINDALTVLLDEPAPPPVAVSADTATLSRPGDSKRGYESDDYVTDSRALDRQAGRAVDLLALASRPMLGLPPIPVPAGNALTKAKVALGRKLFFDRRLSLNDTFSCAMCHLPEQGFTSNELATAVGLEGRSVRRNSPTLYNTAYLQRLFHDAREENLEQQVWGPLLSVNEMANPSVGYVVAKIRNLPDYRGLFEAAFDGRPVGMETIGMAIASYERVLVSGDSAFDRWYYGGRTSAISAAARRGFALFSGKAGCASCHLIGEKHALFTDDLTHNTGIGYRNSMGIRPAKQSLQVAPGVYLQVSRQTIESVGTPAAPDVGQYEVTQDPDDRWKYHTPSLRNVALTAPYMHDGSLSSLRDVVRFYNDGGVPHELLDPRIHPLGLSESEIDDLVAFLRSLTGSNVDQLVADAVAAPIGDVVRHERARDRPR